MDDEGRAHLDELFTEKSIPVIVNRNDVERHVNKSKLHLNDKGIPE